MSDVYDIPDASIIVATIQLCQQEYSYSYPAICYTSAMQYYIANYAYDTRYSYIQ